MSDSSYIDTARNAALAFGDSLLGLARPRLRLGVTGLSRSGKTVFTTALIQNLIESAKLPVLKAASQGRITRVRLVPQPDPDVPRFPYEAHRAAMNGPDRHWPESTRRISELRVEIDYERASGLFKGPATLTLDIVDYPGEWLLDLALIGQDYKAWSAQAVADARKAHRQMAAADWLADLPGRDPDGPPDELAAEAASDLFKGYLARLRANPEAVAVTPPGRFLMPGDLDGSPALTFCPLPGSVADAPSGSLGRMMARRYESYKSVVVKPFFRDHFARLDRQIVLVDALHALNAGPAAVADLSGAMTEILGAYRPGATSWLGGLLTRRIDRILIGATKADHLHHADHDRLERILGHLLAPAVTRAEEAGARVEIAALASVRATREGVVSNGNQKLPSIIGTPLAGEVFDGETYDGRTEIAFFPGDLPDKPESALEGLDSTSQADAALRFVRFRPPQLERTAEGMKLSLPHIRLDRALEFLIGDRLA